MEIVAPSVAELFLFSIFRDHRPFVAADPATGRFQEPAE